MEKKKSSIKDVAKEADVSISTVSYVINNSRFVSKERRERVLNAIEKLDYKPNIIARGLRTKSIKTIGIILPDIANPYYAQVFKGMEEVARKRNYSCIIGCTFYSTDIEKLQLNVMMNQLVDGIIFFCGNDNYENILEVYNAKIPVVVTDREINDKNIPSVLIDNTAAMIKAIDYLHSFNHKKIGYLTFSIDNQTTIRNRYMGYLEGLKRNNIQFDPAIAIIDDTIKLNELEGTYNIFEKIIKNDNLPTAIVAVSDFVAISLIRILSENGLKVPNDVSVIGFDNDNICRFSVPSITTIKQPKKKMGKESMNLLIDIIQGKQIKNKRVFLPTELIKRESVCKIK